MAALSPRLAGLCLVLTLIGSAMAQRRLPPLVDGTVIEEVGAYRHDGPLHIQGKVRIRGIDLDLRGPVTVAPGADLELDHVKIRVSDPPDSSNGASGLR